MVFQGYALYPNMSVEKYLAFGPLVRGDNERDIPRRKRETAAILRIEDLLRRKPSELSGGQRQRVALGRALIRQPRAFLLDEPLSNLDAALRIQMREELIRLHHLLAVTTVYVTHDQVEAMTMGDRVAVMDSGRLLQVGTPNDLYENPRDLFVATFLGAPKMNIFDGELVRTGNGLLAVQALGSCIALTAHQADTLSHLNSSRIIVGLRPSDLHIPLDAPPSCSISLSAVADIVEHLGAESFAMVAVAGASLRARLPRSSGIKFGDSVELRFNPSDLYFFDKESGQGLVERFASSSNANEVTRAGLADTP